MDLRIVLAGRVGLEVDGEPVPDPGLGSLGRLALAYLVVERHRPVSSDELAEVLWGDSLPSTWRSALRGLVSKVRELLATAGVDRERAVASGPGWYQLGLPAGTLVDVEEAAASLVTASTALEGGRAEEAREAATEATAVSARPFVVGGRGTWVEGRADELRELHQRGLETLAHAHTEAGSCDEAVPVARLFDGTRLLTVTGSGGVGKSRLALEVARNGGEGRPAGSTVLVELASLERGAGSDRVAERVADVLGMRLESADLARDLVASLASRRVLLVLDNCEHVESAATLAESLLRSCPGVRILATSQVPLGIPGETVWTLAPLIVPPPTTSSSWPPVPTLPPGSSWSASGPVVPP